MGGGPRRLLGSIIASPEDPRICWIGQPPIDRSEPCINLNSFAEMQIKPAANNHCFAWFC